MQNTKIQWAKHTFNPWWGCIKVSPACDHCYAERLDSRTTRGANETHWGKDTPRLISSDEYWLEPIKWNRKLEGTGKRHQVFCGSMCDVMERRPDLDAPR